MSNQSHNFKIRVYYEDTDAQGIVFYANYLRYTERARTEMLRDGGFDHSDHTNAQGNMFVVRHIEIDYHKSAILDDQLHVESFVQKIGGASVKLKQNVMKGDSLLVETDVTLVCIDQNQKPVRIPDEAREALKKFNLNNS